MPCLRQKRKNHVVMGCIAQNRFRNSIYKLKKVVDSGLAGKNSVVLMWILCGGEVTVIMICGGEELGKKKAEVLR